MARDVGHRVAAVELAVAAARNWSGRTGRPLPAVLTSTSSDVTIPTPVLQIQEEWLDSLDPEAAATYPIALAGLLGASAREHSSTPSLIRIAVTALVARSDTTGAISVFDPAAGSGSLVVTTALTLRRSGATPRLIAQEINPEIARFAASSLFMSGVDGGVATADSLTTDAYPDQSVALAVSVPPFGLSWARQATDVEALHHFDGWYRYGLPQRSDSSWLFASRMIEKVRSPADGGGRVVTFLSPGTATGRSGDSVRTALIEADLVESIIALPSGLHGATELPLFAVVLSNRKSRALEGRVQTVDLRGYYETDRTRRAAPRSFSTAGQEMLERALSSTKSGIVSRTIPSEHFLRTALRIRQPSPSVDLPRTERDARSDWVISMPGDARPDQFLAQRYGRVVPVAESLPPPRQRSTLDIDDLFDPARSLGTQLEEQGWGFTRLSLLLLEEPSTDRDSPSEDPASVVLLPTGREPAGTLVDSVAAKGRVVRLTVDSTILSGSFLAGWFNSAAGVESVERATRTASTGLFPRAVRSDSSSLWRFVDELIVPIPSIELQEEVASAQGRLDAVASMLNESRRRLWDTSSSPAEAVDRFKPVLDESLAAWSNTLPYPIASALRTLETERGNIHAAHKQVFRVWEAYAAFWGTVLLSALDSDPVARDREIESIRSTLLAQKLTMAKATMGSWRIIVERLSKHFRDVVEGDAPEELSRVVQVFGGANRSTLQRLLSPEVVQLLSEANSKRNSWDGHSAALPTSQLENQLEYMDDLLRELRSEISSAWAELQLVRAGDGSKREGQIVQTVEQLTGPVTPFMQTDLRVGDLMERDQLYLATDGAAQPLHLQPLVVLRPGPDNVRTTCYFYNRLQHGQVRLVSYHIAADGEVNEPFGEVGSAAAALIGQDGATD